MHALLVVAVYSVVLAALSLGTFACVWVHGALTRDAGAMPPASQARPWIEGGVVPALVIAAMLITAALLRHFGQ